MFFNIFVIASIAFASASIIPTDGHVIPVQAAGIAPANNGTSVHANAISPDAVCEFEANVFSADNCSGSSFNRCVTSSVGCVRLDTVIGQARSVNVITAGCVAAFYATTNCAGSAIVTSFGGTGCGNLGINALGYKITC